MFIESTFTTIHDCFAFNPLQNPQILIFYLKAPPKISPFSFGDEPLNFGATISISCIITEGDLPLTVLWQHNGQNLTDEQNDMGDIFFTTRGQRIHMLIIESVKARHMGNFSCTATNRAGRTDFTSNLVVKGSIITI